MMRAVAQTRRLADQEDLDLLPANLLDPIWPIILWGVECPRPGASPRPPLPKTPKTKKS